MSGRSQKVRFSFFLIRLAGGDLSELEGKKEGVQVLIGHLLGVFGKDVSWEGL